MEENQEDPSTHMDAVEHSRMLSLLDALERAPKQAKRLFGVLDKRGQGPEFKRLVRRLMDKSHDPELLRSEVNVIREEMR